LGLLNSVIADTNNLVYGEGLVAWEALEHLEGASNNSLGGEIELWILQSWK
jgi:hypothetical protein